MELRPSRPDGLTETPGSPVLSRIEIGFANLGAKYMGKMTQMGGLSQSHLRHFANWRTNDLAPNDFIHFFFLVVVVVII